MTFKLTENQYNLIVHCLELEMPHFTPDEMNDANSIVRNISNYVTVEEVAHTHLRRDLDSL